MSFPFRTLSAAELTEFLEEPRHAIVATARKDGSPQISPVWFLYTDNQLFFTVQSTSAKCTNLRRDPRVAICIDAGHPDARSVTFLGKVELLETEEGHPLDALHHRIARRYLGSEENTARYIEQAESVSALVLVSMSPEKILARDYN